MRCLEKDPALRYGSATDLRHALAPFTQHGAAAASSWSGLSAPPPLSPALAYASAPAPFRPMRVLLVLAGAFAFFVCLAGTLFLIRSSKVSAARNAVPATPAPATATPVIVQVPVPTPPPFTRPPYADGFGPRFGPDGFLADLAARHGKERVVAVYVDELPGDVGSFVTDRLKSLSGASSSFTSGGGGGGGTSVTVHLAPVGDLQRLADRIDFGKVRNVDLAKRTISVDADAAKLPPPLKPAVVNPTDPAFYEQNLADLSGYDAGRRREAIDRLAGASPSSSAAATPLREPIRLALVKATTQGDAGDRRAAIAALAAWAGRAATADLLPLVRDPDRATRLAAIRALKSTADPAAAAALVEALATDRRDAADALKAIGPPAEDAVLAALTSTGDPLVQTEAAQVLGAIGTSKSLPTLKALAAEKRGLAPDAARRAIETIEARGQ
jgi:hypothetical protein